MGVGGGNGRSPIGKEKKKWVQERGRGERGRIYHGRKQRERKSVEENEKGWYFGSCEKNK